MDNQNFEFRLLLQQVCYHEKWMLVGWFGHFRLDALARSRGFGQVRYEDQRF